MSHGTYQRLLYSFFSKVGIFTLAKKSVSANLLMKLISKGDD